MDENTTGQPDRAAVAATIRAEAAARGMSQSELARRIGMERANLNRALQCKTAITLDTFVAIADALGISPRELMDEATARGLKAARRG